MFTVFSSWLKSGDAPEAERTCLAFSDIGRVSAEAPCHIRTVLGYCSKPRRTFCGRSKSSWNWWNSESEDIANSQLLWSCPLAWRKGKYCCYSLEVGRCGRVWITLSITCKWLGTHKYSSETFVKNISNLHSTHKPPSSKYYNTSVTPQFQLTKSLPTPATFSRVPDYRFDHRCDNEVHMNTSSKSHKYRITENSISQLISETLEYSFPNNKTSEIAKFTSPEEFYIPEYSVSCLVSNLIKTPIRHAHYTARKNMMQHSPHYHLHSSGGSAITRTRDPIAATRLVPI